MLIDGALDLGFGGIDWIEMGMRLGLGLGLGGVEAAVGARTARCGTELHWYVVALAYAAGGEAEPVGEDAAALVVRVVGQQTVQPVLLLAATAVTAEHLLELLGAFLPVHVLLEGVEIEQRQHFATRVVRPERSNHLVLDRTRIAVEWRRTLMKLIHLWMDRLHLHSTHIACDCHRFLLHGILEQLPALAQQSSFRSAGRCRRCSAARLALLVRNQRGECGREERCKAGRCRCS